MIHWIHISDLHFNKVGMQTDTMREKLPEYIADLSKSQKIDYIFFTGDIRFAPEKEFPDEVPKYFNDLCQVALVDKNNFFCVLGNHDIDRNNKKRLEAIKELEENYLKNDSVISKKLIQKLKTGRNKCLKVLKEIITPDQYAFHSNTTMLHFLIETSDFNIVHVDSTLTYRKEKTNDFFIGTYALKNILNKCNKEKPTIILSHYAIDSFEPAEQKAILRLLKDYYVQLWFSGHKHTDIIYKDRDYFYVAHSGNQTFEQSTSPGFVEGFLNTDSGEGFFKVHKWNESSGWAIYQTLIEDKKEKDVYDKTKYPFILDDWLKANGKEFSNSSHSNSIIEKVKSYISNYKGDSFLLESIINDLNINEDVLLNIFSQLQKDGYIRALNYEKTQWQILRKPQLLLV